MAAGTRTRVAPRQLRADPRRTARTTPRPSLTYGAGVVPRCRVSCTSSPSRSRRWPRPCVGTNPARSRTLS